MEHIHFGSTLATVEREYILDTLAHCDGNRTYAAKLLGISLRCLRIKLHNYAGSGVAVPSPCHGIGRSQQPHHSAKNFAH
jgi:DNA-binding NtrC family response regulator